MPEKIDVAAQLDVLIKLQEIDAQIYKLRDEKQRKPKDLARLEAEFQEKKAGLKKSEEKSTALQLKKKEKEGTLQAKEESIKKLQGQLYQIKTNKEYSVMQHEIESQKADKSATEDEVLILMEDIDKAKAEIAKEKEILAREEVKLKEEEARVKTELEEIEKRLQQLDEQRQAVLPQVGREVLKKYEKILVSKDGLALVPVNNNACQGCNMNLPPQVINEIRLKDKFIICENCTRFLYINDSPV